MVYEIVMCLYCALTVFCMYTRQYIILVQWRHGLPGSTCWHISYFQNKKRLDHNSVSSSGSRSSHPFVHVPRNIHQVQYLPGASCSDYRQLLDRNTSLPDLGVYTVSSRSRARHRVQPSVVVVRRTMLLSGWLKQTTRCITWPRSKIKETKWSELHCFSIQRQRNAEITNIRRLNHDLITGISIFIHFQIEIFQ